MIEPMYKIYTVDLSKPQDPQMLAIQEDFGTTSCVSPGAAGAYLGISRQAIDQACKKGALRAYKIMDKNGKMGKSRLSAIMIDCASLDAYKELRELNGGRIPYRARAI